MECSRCGKDEEDKENERTLLNINLGVIHLCSTCYEWLSIWLMAHKTMLESAIPCPECDWLLEPLLGGKNVCGNDKCKNYLHEVIIRKC